MTESAVPGWWWVVFTLLAAGGQTLRNIMQRSLTESLGTIGATHVRFLFGLPFAVLSLAGMAVVLKIQWPHPPNSFWAWTALGAVTQILGTALMLAAMRVRSFVVATAYVKTEPVQVALFALVFLGDRLSGMSVAAILIATAGVMSMSWPGRAAGSAARDWIGMMRPASLGIAAGAMFALAAVGFRGAILTLQPGSFVVAATLTLVCGLALQTALLTLYLAIASRRTLFEIVAAWRPSLLAGFMGAFASQMWFLAFAIEPAARVRTLGLIEILFAQAISKKMFAQGTSGREIVGIALVVVGVLLLING
jgi:drug/metabolite transporter (DMT)-like permease